MKIGRNTEGTLLIAVSAFSFGVMPVFAKIAYATGASTSTLLFLRFFIGAAFMFLLMFARRFPLPSKREIVAFLLLGAVGYFGQSYCYFEALKYLPAGVVSLLLYTYPILVMIGSAVFLKERITARKTLALILAVAGVFVIVGTEFQANPIGVALGLASALVYTVYILVNSKVVREGMGVQSSAFIMLGSAIVFGVLNLFFGFEPPSGVDGWGSVLLIALISTVLAIWAFLTGLEKTGASSAALASTLEPVTSVVFSALIISEPLTPTIILGGALVLSALIITAWPSRDPANGQSLAGGQDP